MERRRALEMMVHGGSAIVALVVGVPTLIYAVSPGMRASDEPIWRDLGRFDDFPVGEMTAAKVLPEGTVPRDGMESTLMEERDVESGVIGAGVYVWRVDERETIVFSRSCTDLGCPVTFDRGSECFLCPCHGGIFSKRGERMAGPPDKPLYRYETRVVEGVLQVDLMSVPPMV